MLMTALTSGIGLVPLAMAAGEPGKEILYPVATVIIGGLITSTLLEFLVRPALFWKFGLRAAEHVVRRAQDDVALTKEFSLASTKGERSEAAPCCSPATSLRPPCLQATCNDGCCPSPAETSFPSPNFSVLLARSAAFGLCVTITIVRPSSLNSSKNPMT